MLMKTLQGKRKGYAHILALLLVVFAIFPVTLYAQENSEKKVSGVVTDESNEPVSGATVVVLRTKAGATTDASGKFTITVKSGDKIEVSYVGKTTSVITYTNQPNLTVTLKSDGKGQLEEAVVISTGYQQLDRKLFTGASTKVSAKDAERNGIPDVSRMLEGQVAGVSVQNVSGTFGAAPKIRVRGATSLSGDNKPLWVVDGIILEDVVNISNEALSTGDANTLIGSSVAGLNPDDIESFTILKDAAATALYGARAMNGVIVVNTKKGKNTQGKAVVSYTGTFTTYLKPNYDQFDIMNSAEQMGVMIEMENKGFYRHSAMATPQNGGVFYKLYNQMYDYNATTDTWNLKNGLDQADKYRFLERYAKANTDWFDVLFKNSLMQEHSLSVTAGSGNVQNYFSTSFLKDYGQTLGDNVSRFTANLRTNFKINSKLSFELLGTTSIRDQRAPGTQTRASDPVYGTYSRDFDINPYSYSLNTSRLITPYEENGDLEYFVRNWAPFNIINELEKNYLKLQMLDIKVQGGIRYKIIPELQYSVDGAYRYAQTTRQHYIKEGANMAESFRAYTNTQVINDNQWLYDDPDNPNTLPVIILPEGGFFNTNENKIANYYFRQNLEYDKTFSSHRVNAFASMELRSTDRQDYDFDGIAYQYENGGLVNPNYRFFKKMIEAGDPYFGMSYGADRFAAFMFRGAYNFEDRFTFNVTARYDGSNKMGKSAQARWLPTWNISGAWDLENEKFFTPNPVISSARIRGTYGLVANVGNATNTSAVFYNRISYRPYETEKEALTYISSLENSDLTWEKLYELNIGTDIGLFNNRFNVTADIYKRNIFDLIGSIQTSGIGGQFRKTANYGEMQSKGFELTVGGMLLRSNVADGFRWRSSVNFGINKTEITQLEVAPNIWSLVRAEGNALLGYPQRGLFSIQFDGLNPVDGTPLFINAFGVRDNYIWLQDNYVDYLKYEGPVDPTLTGGFHNKWEYKGISLSTLFTFSFGNFIRLQPAFSATYNDFSSMSKEVANRWIMPGDEQLTTIPSILDRYNLSNFRRYSTGTSVNAAYAYNPYNYSTERVAKGDFIRFKTISLAYQLPKTLIERWGLNAVQVTLVGNNIVLLYSDKKLLGADPEFFNNGGVAMPIPRQYTFSIKVGL